jgi:hypothetical protein
MHMMIGSREVPSVDKLRSQRSYPWIETALRIAQPLDECLFDRQARKGVELRSLVPNGEAPLSRCDGRHHRSTVTAAI